MSLSRFAFRWKRQPNATRRYSSSPYHENAQASAAPTAAIAPTTATTGKDTTAMTTTATTATTATTGAAAWMKLEMKFLLLFPERFFCSGHQRTSAPA
jgi:hypothetical protein